MAPKHTNAARQEITDAAAAAFVQSITPSAVQSVYSGRAGCMCGCRGRHRYNPRHVEEAEADRGYEIDADEVSSRSCSIVLGKIKRAPGACVQDGSILYLETEDRCLAVYLTDAAVLR